MTQTFPQDRSKMMHRLGRMGQAMGIGLLIAGMLLGLSACTPNKRPAAEASASVPEDLRIIFGTEGGFAGRMHGYTIDAGGGVEQWEGKHVGENVQRRGRLTTDQVATLWEQVQAARFFEQQQQEYGNMTAFINVTAAGESRRLTWPHHVGGDLPDTPLQRLYTVLEQAVQEGNLQATH